MKNDINYFAQQDAATQYAVGRPYIHPQAVAHMQNFLHLQEPVSQALDVGCGTGQSCVALTAIAADIVGVDPSQAMLAQALPHEHVRYVCAPAEQLPFPDHTFDLITVAIAFHWFDRSRFLREAARVLSSSGWLVIYNGGFLGKVLACPDLEDWYWNTFMTRYPLVSNFNRQTLTIEETHPYGFHFLHRDHYTLELVWTPQDMASYLLSMSHVLTKVEQGAEQKEDIANWLFTSLTASMPNSTATFLFGGDIEYWQRDTEK